MESSIKTMNVTRDIEVDFYSQEYIFVNAKQYDKISRFLKITCCNQGEPVALDSTKCKAYIRYRKADDLGTFNECVVTEDGKVIVELTDQMLAVAGICYGDLVIYKIDDVTTEVLTATDSLYISDDNVTILATMTFYINVKAAALDNAEIESSNEFNALSDALTAVMNDYTSVITTCNNFKLEAGASAEAALGSETNAKASAEAAAASETNAENWSLISKSWAVGGTEKREGEDENNAKHWCDIAIQNATDAINTLKDSKATFSPMGTITSIDDLPTIAEGTEDDYIGQMYCIETEFTTTNDFRTPGKSYPPGTFVYYTADGKWDCFEVTLEAIDAITVEDFKAYLGI